MKQERFPFKTRFAGHIAEVTGRHECGLYRVTGFGLVRGPLVPLEDVLEMPRFASESTAVEPEQVKPWRKRGFFSEPYKPVPRRVRQERNRETRCWLKEAMRHAPVEASAVLSSARRYGIPARSLYKAKKFYSVASYKRGGYRGREGARWFWAYSLPD